MRSGVAPGWPPRRPTPGRGLGRPGPARTWPTAEAHRGARRRTEARRRRFASTGRSRRGSRGGWGSPSWRGRSGAGRAQHGSRPPWMRSGAPTPPPDGRRARAPGGPPWAAEMGAITSAGDVRDGGRSPPPRLSPRSPAARARRGRPSPPGGPVGRRARIGKARRPCAVGHAAASDGAAHRCPAPPGSGAVRMASRRAGPRGGPGSRSAPADRAARPARSCQRDRAQRGRASAIVKGWTGRTA